MKFLIVLSAMLAVAFARPGVLLAPQLATLPGPVVYTKLVPGAPIGLDGRVVDTPEVAYAKAEHAAAHINEKYALAKEAANSAEHFVSYSSPVLANSVHPLTYASIIPAAPLGHDGRVVDTPEVAYAKAEHAAAHLNAKLAHSAGYTLDLPYVRSPYSTPIVEKVLY